MPARIESTLTLTDLPIVCWRNSVTTANLQAESDPDFPVTNLANPSTALLWKQDFYGSPASATEYIIIDLASENINYVAIAGHNFASEGIAVGLELQSYNSPLGGADIVFDAQVPTDDGPIVFLFSTREVEGVRIFYNPSATTPAQAAVVYTGQFTQFDDGIQADHTPLPLGRVSEVSNGKSENGAFLGRIVTAEGLSSPATISNMDVSFVRDELIDFLAFASESPFFWLWQPDTYPEDTAFAWLDNDPQPSRDIDGYWSVDLSMKGLGA